MTSIRPLLWCLRRELWESRSIYLAPAAAGMLFLLGFLISTIQLPAKMRSIAALDAVHQRDAIAIPFDMAAGLLMITAMVVGAFYSVDALQGERRDRSILFWKSLPVSDRTTVLAKAMVPMVFLPLLTFLITAALQFAMLIISSAVLSANHMNAGAMWTRLSYFRMTLLLLYHLLTVHALCQAPLYGWLLLVSAWARRAALLWAVLPPVVIGTFERIVFSSSRVTDLLQELVGGSGREAITQPGTMPMNPMTHPTPVQLLISPGLWIGLTMTAVFLAAAVRLRHNRQPVH